MGKIDDMRRQREKQAEQRGPTPSKAAVRSSTTEAVEIEPAQPTRPTTSRTSPSKSSVGTAEHGKCPACGKTKALQGGVMANHQKGFGKMCAGSRAKPA